MNVSTELVLALVARSVACFSNQVLTTTQLTPNTLASKSPEKTVKPRLLPIKKVTPRSLKVQMPLFPIMLPAENGSKKSNYRSRHRNSGSGRY